MARIKRTDLQKELLEEYRKIAHQNNQRLRELEKLSKTEGYENILKYAYRVAERDVKELGIGDVNKVRYRIPTNTNKLKSALRRAKEFNQMVTSKKSTIDEMYQKDTINFNKAFGTNFTWQELREFTKASNWNELKREKGSAVLQLAIRSVTNKMPKPEDIKAVTDKHKKVSDDEVAAELVQVLEKDGLKIDMLYKGTGDFVSDDSDDNPFIN